MRSRGFWFGSVMTMSVVMFSAVAFVQTAHPVQAGSTISGPGKVTCPTGASGIPSSCAEVHAAALASGAMSRAQFDFAQVSITALAAHTVSQ